MKGRVKGLGNAQIRNFPETQNDSEERDDGSREWGIILVSGFIYNYRGNGKIGTLSCYFLNAHVTQVIAFINPMRFFDSLVIGSYSMPYDPVCP